jgi:hypothetical protein
MQLFMALFLVKAENGPGLHKWDASEESSLNEVLDVAYFAEDQLPELSQGHHLRVPLAFQLTRGEVKPPYYDPA